MNLRIKKSGKINGFTGHEYIIYYPDGTTDSIYSPDTHDMMPAEEDMRALEVARELWDIKSRGKDLPDDLIPNSTLQELKNMRLSEEEVLRILEDEQMLENFVQKSTDTEEL